MPDVTREVLIVHGWSDSYESFQPLKNLLAAVRRRQAATPCGAPAFPLAVAPDQTPLPESPWRPASPGSIACFSRR